MWGTALVAEQLGRNLRHGQPSGKGILFMTKDMQAHCRATGSSGVQRLHEGMSTPSTGALDSTAAAMHGLNCHVWCLQDKRLLRTGDHPGNSAHRVAIPQRRAIHFNALLCVMCRILDAQAAQQGVHVHSSWSACLQAYLNTALVLVLVGGTSVFLFLVNSLLSELSTVVYRL